MARPRLTNWLAASVLVAILLPAPSPSAAAPSLGEKIRQIFVSPSPTPSRHRTKRKSSPSPSPSATPKRKAKKKASPTPTDTPTPTRTPTPGTMRKKERSPTPSPSPDETPSPTPTPTETPSPSPSPSPNGQVSTIAPNEIENFEENPEPVRKLLEEALALTRRNLDYSYGSADPENGGMDCSGFIYYLLRQRGIEDVPRDSSGQYVWVRKAGNFRVVLSRKLDSFELDELSPGDLLFWSGTYEIERDPPITHTMIYLGKEKDSGKPIMVGSSDGRTYHGEKRFGVSVFDFKTTPAKETGDSGKHPRFVGYGKIPGFKAGKD